MLKPLAENETTHFQENYKKKDILQEKHPNI